AGRARPLRPGRCRRARPRRPAKRAGWRTGRWAPGPARWRFWPSRGRARTAWPGAKAWGTKRRWWCSWREGLEAAVGFGAAAVRVLRHLVGLFLLAAHQALLQGLELARHVLAQRGDLA